MARGHGIIVNMSSWIPFVFMFNPSEVSSKKVINYAIAPNIGGSYKRRYFSGFESKEVSLKLMCLDKISPIGVSDEVAFFESLREPDPGPFGVANSFFGNTNFPPPKVLFQFSQSFVPLVWTVVEVNIKTSHFFDDPIRGVIGIPKVCDVDIRLALDEEDILFKANQIAKKAEAIYAGVDSVIKQIKHQRSGTRVEASGITSLSVKKPSETNVGGNV